MQDSTGESRLPAWFRRFTAVVGAILGLATLAFAVGYLALAAQFDIARVPFIYIDYWAYAETGLMSIIRSTYLFLQSPWTALLLAAATVAIVLWHKRPLPRRALENPAVLLVGSLAALSLAILLVGQQLAVHSVRAASVATHASTGDAGDADERDTVPAFSLFDSLGIVPPTLPPPEQLPTEFPTTSFDAWERIADDLERELQTGATRLQTRPRPHWISHVVTRDASASVDGEIEPTLGATAALAQLPEARAVSLYRVIVSVFVLVAWLFLMMRMWQKSVKRAFADPSRDRQSDSTVHEADAPPNSEAQPQTPTRQPTATRQDASQRPHDGETAPQRGHATLALLGHMLRPFRTCAVMCTGFVSRACQRARREIWVTVRYVVNPLVGIIVIVSGALFMPECYGALAMPTVGHELVEVTLREQREADATDKRNVQPASDDAEGKPILDPEGRFRHARALAKAYVDADSTTKAAIRARWIEDIAEVEGYRTRAAADWLERVTKAVAEGLGEDAGELAQISFDAHKRIRSPDLQVLALSTITDSFPRADQDEKLELEKRWKAIVHDLELERTRQAGSILQKLRDVATPIAPTLAAHAHDAWTRIAESTSTTRVGYILHYPRSESGSLRLLTTSALQPRSRWSILPLRAENVQQVRVQRDDKTSRLIVLLRSMRDLDLFNRENALYEIQLLGHRWTLEVMLAGMFDSSADVRLPAVTLSGCYTWALDDSTTGRLRRDRAIETLLHLIEEPSYRDDVRGSAASALSMFLKQTDETVGTRLLGVLNGVEATSTDPHWLVRGPVISALGAMRYRLAVPKLIEILNDKTQTPAQTRVALPTALRRIGERLQTVPVLVQIIEDPAEDHYVIGTALSALSLARPDNTGAREALATFIRTTSFDESRFNEELRADLQNAALLSINLIGAPEALELYHEILKDRRYETQVREFAVLSAGELRIPTSERLLIELTEDESEPEDLRTRAAVSLAQFNGRGVTDRLYRLAIRLRRGAVFDAIADTMELRGTSGSSDAKSYAKQLRALSTGPTVGATPADFRRDAAPDPVAGRELRRALESRIEDEPFPGQFADVARITPAAPGLLELWLQQAPDGVDDPNAFRLACVRALRDVVTAPPSQLMGTLSAVAAHPDASAELTQECIFALAQFGDPELLDMLVAQLTPFADRDNPAAIDRLAMIYRGARDYANERAQYARLLRLIESEAIEVNDTAVATLHYRSAQASALGGEIEQAVADLRRALEAARDAGEPIERARIDGDRSLDDARDDEAFGAMLDEFYG